MKHEPVIWLGELGALHDAGNILCLEFWDLWEEIRYDGPKTSTSDILYDMTARIAHVDDHRNQWYN